MPSNDSDFRFLSTLSHDLRGGLHSVQLALDMLRRDVLESEPMEQMLGDVELARRSLIDSGARAERIICARRIHKRVMPVRVAESDVVAAVQHAVRAAVASDEDDARRLHIQAPNQALIRTDARLCGEIVGGLLDHALRSVRSIDLKVALDAGGLLEVHADREWIDGDARAMLTVATVDPPFAQPTLGLYVAAGAARLLGNSIQVTSERAVAVSFVATAAPMQ